MTRHNNRARFPESIMESLSCKRCGRRASGQGLTSGSEMALPIFFSLNFLLSFFVLLSLSHRPLFFAAPSRQESICSSRERAEDTSDHTLTKGHDGARVDRPHGGGSGARSRRDGRRRRRRVRPCDGRHDCRRARGDAPSVRHAEGRHGGVWSQRERCEGRALLERRRCGEGKREKPFSIWSRKKSEGPS